MSKYVTISLKILREDKERLEKAGLKPSQVAKEAVRRRARKIRLELLEKKLEGLSGKLRNISGEEVAEMIREDRER